MNLFKWLPLLLLLSATLTYSKTILLSNLTDPVINVIRGTTIAHSPGDTLAIPAGSYASLRFIDFKGDASKPLIIKNHNGVVRIKSSKYTGISFQKSAYITITSTGVKNITYGIVIDTVASGSSGLAIEAFSSDITVENLEISHTGFAGIMAKTDPTCSDTNTWRTSGFIMKNIIIRNNYIHHTHGEGIYIGYTGGYLVNSKVVCNSVPVFAHWLENVEVSHNKFAEIGWDGIQVNLVRKGGKIHFNSVHNYGLAQETYQNFGMSIGGGHYSIHGNHITNDSLWGPKTASGIQLLSAMSGTSLTHNVFTHTGLYGIFIHNRNEFDNPSVGYLVANNTLAYSTRSTLFYNAGITESFDAAMIGNSQLSTPFIAINNLCISPTVDYATQNTWKKDNESFIDFNDKALRDANINNLANNYYTRTPQTLGLNSDYSIHSANSPLINAGASSVNSTQVLDFWGNKLYNGTPDIGAHEWYGSSKTLLFAKPLLSPQLNTYKFDLLGRIKD